MKIKLMAFFVIGIVVLPLTIHDSCGMNFVQAIDKYKIVIYVKIQVRNHDGQLVSYLESSSVFDTKINELNKYLDQAGNAIQKSIVTVNGKNYEVIKGVGVKTYQSDTVISESYIFADEGGNQTVLTKASHDGYLVTKGDKVISIWTIIRPAH